MTKPAGQLTLLTREGCGLCEEFEAELRAYREASLPMYDRLPCQRDLAYGPSPDETLDLFPVPDDPAAAARSLCAALPPADPSL